MPKYVIEREVSGVGNLSEQELKGIFQHGLGCASEMGPGIEWLHSYITGDKVYCVFNSPNAEMLREHSQKAGFPANNISEVVTLMDPARLGV